MYAKDIMTSHVISVTPDATVAKVAQLLVEYGISAVLVISNGRMLGLVSEGDLMRRVEIGTAHAKPSRWSRLLAGDEVLERNYIKSHATSVRDVMSTDIVTITDNTKVIEIPAILEINHIKRVPVVRDGEVVGIVSRADLVRKLATVGTATSAADVADDTHIRKQLLAALAAQSWARHIVGSNITVSDGVVALRGVYTQTAERDALRVMAESIPGVRSVKDHRVPEPTAGYV